MNASQLLDVVRFIRKAFQCCKWGLIVLQRHRRRLVASFRRIRCTSIYKIESLFMRLWLSVDVLSSTNPSYCYSSYVYVFCLARHIHITFISVFCRCIRVWSGWKCSTTQLNSQSVDHFIHYTNILFCCCCCCCCVVIRTQTRNRNVLMMTKRSSVCVCVCLSSVRNGARSVAAPHTCYIFQDDIDWWKTCCFSCELIDDEIAYRLTRISSERRQRQRPSGKRFFEILLELLSVCRSMRSHFSSHSNVNREPRTSSVFSVSRTIRFWWCDYCAIVARMGINRWQMHFNW